MSIKLYQQLVQTQMAIDSCRKTNNTLWQERHEEKLAKLAKTLPSGSGIDNGTTIEQITENKIVLSFGFHHMDENGFYNGWTQHRCTVKPSLVNGIDLSITGPNKNDIKDYLYEVYFHTLTNEV